PAAAIGVTGLVIALGRVADILFVLGAAVMIPVVASAMYLVFPWRSQRIVNPDRVTIHLVSALADGMFRQLGLRWNDWQRRAVLRRSLLTKARPIVADQFAEFWRTRAQPAGIAQVLDHLETTIVSLEFLTLLYLLCSIFPLFGFYGYGSQL